MSKSLPSTGTDPQKIWSLLAALQTLNAPVSVHAANSDSGVKSRVMAVDAERGVLMLDVPGLSLDAIPAPLSWRIEAQVQGRFLEFGCIVERAVQLDDGPAFVAHEPILLSDRQRRGAYRVRVPAKEALNAAIGMVSFNGHGKALQTRVTDLSVSGFGAIAAQPLEMPEGMKVHCQIALPDIAVFVDATVRHQEGGSDATHIGLQFTEITSVLETLLTQSIVRMERRNLRERPR